MSQLPGFRTQMVRYAIELTWSPTDGKIALSRRVFSRDVTDERWSLEDVAVSAPMTWNEVEDACRVWVTHAVDALLRVEQGSMPFE